MQQTTFENSVTKGVVAHHEQFHLLSQWFQLYLIIKLFFMKIVLFFDNRFSKSSALDVMYVGKAVIELCNGSPLHTFPVRHLKNQTII